MGLIIGAIIGFAISTLVYNAKARAAAKAKTDEILNEIKSSKVVIQAENEVKVAGDVVKAKVESIATEVKNKI